MPSFVVHKSRLRRCWRRCHESVGTQWRLEPHGVVPECTELMTIERSYSTVSGRHDAHTHERCRWTNRLQLEKRQRNYMGGSAQPSKTWFSPRLYKTEDAAKLGASDMLELFRAGELVWKVPSDWLGTSERRTFASTSVAQVFSSRSLCRKSIASFIRAAVK